MVKFSKWRIAAEKAGPIDNLVKNWVGSYHGVSFLIEAKAGGGRGRKTIRLGIEKFNNDILALRTHHFFDKKIAPGDAFDQFDQHSFFSTIRFENTLIGAERITETSEISVFEKWLSGKICMPKGKDIYEISRTAIRSEWRGKALYNILTMFSIEYLKKYRNAKKINFIIDIHNNLYLHKWIQKIGSEKYGHPCECHDFPCEPLLVQAYTFNVKDDKNSNLCQEQSDRIANVINNKMDYTVISNYEK